MLVCTVKKRKMNFCQFKCVNIKKCKTANFLNTNIKLAEKTETIQIKKLLHPMQTVLRNTCGETMEDSEIFEILFNPNIILCFSLFLFAFNIIRTIVRRDFSLE